jgi:hypothetical protein
VAQPLQTVPKVHPDPQALLANTETTVKPETPEITAQMVKVTDLAVDNPLAMLAQLDHPDLLEPLAQLETPALMEIPDKMPKAVEPVPQDPLAQLEMPAPLEIQAVLVMMDNLEIQDKVVDKVPLELPDPLEAPAILVNLDTQVNLPVLAPLDQLVLPAQPEPLDNQVALETQVATEAMAHPVEMELIALAHREAVNRVELAVDHPALVAMEVGPAEAHPEDRLEAHPAEDQLEVHQAEEVLTTQHLPQHLLQFPPQLLLQLLQFPPQLRLLLQSLKPRLISTLRLQ